MRFYPQVLAKAHILCYSMAKNYYPYPGGLLMKKFYVLLICILFILAGAAVLSDLPLGDTNVTDPPAPPTTTEPTEPPTVPPTPPTVPDTTAPTDPPVTDPTDPPETDPTDPVTLPPETAPVVYDLPMTSIVLTDHTEVYEDDDGTILFTYTYQNVMLNLQDQDLVDTITLDLLNRIDSTRTQADSVREDAEKLGIGANPFFFNVRYTPQRIDSGVLSLSYMTASYSGGAHPGNSCGGVTYDLVKGKALSLGDILTDGTTADVICRLVVDALAENPNVYRDYSATVEQRFSGYIQEDQDWYLSREGLCFSFAPYEIAPYASGVVTAVVPYSQLLGVLEDAYFPMEQVYSQGNLSAVLFHEADPTLYASLTEVILEPQGAPFLLTTDDLIYDVTITQGYWDYTGTRFIPEATVFTADRMTPGNAIMVQAYIPDVMSNLQITYTSGDQTITVYLFQSGEDGSALLLPG